MKKRIVVLALICLACAVLFSSCSLLSSNGGNTKTNTETNSDTSTDEKVEGSIYIDSVYTRTNIDETAIEVTVSVISDTEMDGGKLIVYDMIGSRLAQEEIYIESDTYDYSVEIPISKLFTSSQRIVDETGIQLVKVELVPPENLIDDTSDNAVYTSYKYEREGRILVVKGDDTQDSQLDIIWDKILDSGCNLEVYEPSRFPRSLELMLDYDAIILMNVDYSELPANALDNIKAFVEKLGRGLLVTCGDNILDQNGNIVSTELDEMLPVTFIDPKEEKSKVSFLIDVSPSMGALVYDSGEICTKCGYFYSEGTRVSGTCLGCGEVSTFSEPTRYHLVLENLRKAIFSTQLEDDDDVIVSLLDQSDGYVVSSYELGGEAERQALYEKVVYNMNHCYYAYYIDNSTGRESEIRINIEKDGVPGESNIYVDGDNPKYSMNKEYVEGTVDMATGDSIKTSDTVNLDWSLTKACTHNDEYADNQVILITDSEPQDLDYTIESGLISAVSSGIEISVITLDIDDKNTVSLYEALATKGRGEFYKAEDIYELELGVNEIIDSFKNKQFVKAGEPVKLEIGDYGYSSVHQDLTGPVYENIYGYYYSKIKEGAYRDIIVGNFCPIYSHWNYGNGYVAVLSTDLGNTNWTGDLFNDNDGYEYSTLVKNILVDAKRDYINRTGLELEVTTNSSSISFNVISSYQTKDNEQMVAKLYSFDGDDYTLEEENAFEFEKLDDEHFTLLIEKQGNEPYIVIIELIKVKGDGSPVEYPYDGDDAVKDRVAYMVVK